MNIFNYISKIVYKDSKFSLYLITYFAIKFKLARVLQLESFYTFRSNLFATFDINVDIRFNEIRLTIKSLLILS